MKRDRVIPATARIAGALALAVAASLLAKAMASASATRQVAGWVARSGDNRGAPYAILDKVDARLCVFDAAGRLHQRAGGILRPRAGAGVRCRQGGGLRAA